MVVILNSTEEKRYICNLAVVVEDVEYLYHPTPMPQPNVQNHCTHSMMEVNRKWQDYVYIQCEYKSTKQKIKHLLREENKVKENKIS